jgi:hypothetical protein
LNKCLDSRGYSDEQWQIDVTRLPVVIIESDKENMKFMLSICTAVGLLAGGLAIHAIPPVRGDFPPPQDENNAAISGLSSSSSSSTSSGPEPQFAGASTIDLSDFHPEKNPEHKCVHDELLEKHGETIRAQQITLLPPPDDARSVRTEGNATGTMR